MTLRAISQRTCLATYQRIGYSKERKQQWRGPTKLQKSNLIVTFVLH